MDHGCRDAAMASAQLALAASAGVDVLVATPHFYPHRHRADSFARHRRFAAEELACVRAEGQPRVLCGAEVLVSPGLDRMEGLSALCVEGTRVLLLELPFNGLNEDIWQTVCRIRDLGFHPLLAHIDRYDRAAALRAQELGLDVQLNAAALSSPLGRNRRLRRWEGLHVCALGSDIHGADGRAYRAFSRACHALGPDSAAVMDRAEHLLTLSPIQ